jgi:hypothetical protein
MPRRREDPGRFCYLAGLEVFVNLARTQSPRRILINISGRYDSHARQLFRRHLPSSALPYRTVSDEDKLVVPINDCANQVIATYISASIP